jgi:hypothetical protein
MYNIACNTTYSTIDYCLLLRGTIKYKNASSNTITYCASDLVKCFPLPSLRSHNLVSEVIILATCAYHSLPTHLSEVKFLAAGQRDPSTFRPRKRICAFRVGYRVSVFVLMCPAVSLPVPCSKAFEVQQ